MCNLWTAWHWDRIFFAYVGTLLSVSFLQCSTLLHYLICHRFHMNLSINSVVKQHVLQSLTKSSPALHAVSWQVDTRTSVSHSFPFRTRRCASHRCHCAMWRSGLSIVCLSCCSGQAESRPHLRNSRDWDQQPVVSSAPQIMNWVAEVHKDWGYSPAAYVGLSSPLPLT